MNQGPKNQYKYTTKHQQGSKKAKLKFEHQDHGRRPAKLSRPAFAAVCTSPEAAGGHRSLRLRAPRNDRDAQRLVSSTRFFSSCFWHPTSDSGILVYCSIGFPISGVRLPTNRPSRRSIEAENDMGDWQSKIGNLKGPRAQSQWPKLSFGPWGTQALRA